MAKFDEVRDLVLSMARCLVDTPESVGVEAVDGDGGTQLKLTVAPGEVGRVIGKQGRTARSIRTILSGISVKMNHRISLDIIEG